MQCMVVVLIAFAAIIGWWPAVAVAWNTVRLYGTPMRARLTDVAVWRNHAYACWPRADASQPVTLLELPWPETVDEQPQQPSSWTPSRPFCADQQRSSNATANLSAHIVTSRLNITFYIILYSWFFQTLKKCINCCKVPLLQSLFEHFHFINPSLRKLSPQTAISYSILYIYRFTSWGGSDL
ncbi:hypothetical protein QTP88_008949 [Uroleucon formosanum]